MDWGNAIGRTKSIDAAGTVTEIGVDLHLEGDVKKTKKKITELAAPKDNHPLPTVSLVDFDYLLRVVLETPGMHMWSPDSDLATASARHK